MVLAAVGWALTVVSLLGFPGPDYFYMGAGPAIGSVCVFAALLAMWLQPFRGGIGRTLLLLAAFAVAAVGVLYAHAVGLGRVLLGNFVPAALFFAAAAALQAPRVRERTV